jgi:hypothetical protein
VSKKLDVFTVASLVTTSFAVMFGIGVGHLMHPGRDLLPQMNTDSLVSDDALQNNSEVQKLPIY